MVRLYFWVGALYNEVSVSTSDSISKTTGGFSRIVQETWRPVVLYPFSLLVLQVFEMISEACLAYAEDLSDQRWALALLIVPAVWFMSVFSTAATFDFLRQAKTGRPSLRAAFAALGTHAVPLLTAGFISGLVIIPGLIILVPGIYFFGLYLFVPCFVMSEPRAPAFNYLALSSALSRGRRVKIVLVATAIVLLSLGLDELQKIWSSDTENVFLRVAPSVFFGMALTAFSNSFITACFFHFQENPRN